MKKKKTRRGKRKKNHVKGVESGRAFKLVPDNISVLCDDKYMLP